MNLNDMRAFVSKLYPGKWPDRVENMPAAQVYAIFHRYYSYKDDICAPEPKLNTKNIKIRQKSGNKKSQRDDGVQLSFEDLFGKELGLNEKGKHTNNYGYLR